MRKIERELTDIARRRGFEVEICQAGSGHYRVTVSRAGRRRTFTTAGSPKNTDVTLRNFAQDLRRYWR